MTNEVMQGSVTVARLAHNPKAAGSIPVPATNFPCDGWEDIQACPQRAAHARKLIADVGAFNPDAAAMVKYLAEFIMLTAAPDMLAMRLFPNAKEISESFAAYDAVRYRLPQFSLSDPDVTIVAVGDGRTPRTAATFALRSKWNCYSVDPESKGGTRRWAAIRRLTVIPKRIEHVRITARRVIVVAVHSHANLKASVAAISADEIAVVAMPCCVPMKLDREPDREYQDKGIISACRTIKIWNSVQPS